MNSKDKKFEDLAKELLGDILFYQNEESGKFIFGSVNMKKSFIKLLEEYLEDFKEKLYE